jgi:dipeptidase E
MRFLLTSAGISNTSIHNALVDLLGKPIAESSALCIPTGAYAMSSGAAAAWRVIREWDEWGWKSFGVLELTAVPNIQEDHWLPLVQAADALLVGGGENLYLCYWMRQSGLADLLPSLRRETVYVGVSGGSMVVTPNFGETYDGRNPPTGSDRALGLVDFTLHPHLDNESMPEYSLANLERWAAWVQMPTYVIDDQTAIIPRGSADSLAIFGLCG